jgi:RNA polymerase sigma-70 factor, ECF subfamily
VGELSDSGETRAQAASGPRYQSAAALFRSERDRLVRVLAVAYGDREAAADAVQEAFVQLYLKWDRISEYDDPVAWVRRAAINRLRNERRSLRRLSGALQRLGEQHTSAQLGAGADPSVAASPRLSDVMEAIRALSPRRRLILALFYLDDLSVRQIADSLGISEGSVKRQLHDGRDELRRRLETR